MSPYFLKQATTTKKKRITHFVLSFHLRFQVRNESCFEILDALKIEKFQFLFNRFGNDIKFFLASIDFSLPLNQIHVCQTTRQIQYFRAKMGRLRSETQAHQKP